METFHRRNFWITGLVFFAVLLAVLVGQFITWNHALDTAAQDAMARVRKDYSTVAPAFAQWDRCNRGEIKDNSSQPIITLAECDRFVIAKADEMQLPQNTIATAIKAQAVAIEFAQANIEPAWPLSVVFPASLRYMFWFYDTMGSSHTVKVPPATKDPFNESLQSRKNRDG